METNNPSEADTSEQGVSSEEANENVSGTSILETINQATGRDYKSDEEAIKGIKETTSYVGKVGKYKDTIAAIEEAKGGEQGAIDALKGLVSKEPAEKPSETTDTNQILLEKISTLEDDSFFNANSDLADHRDLIGKLRKPGQTLADVVAENKSTLEMLKTSSSNQSSKSVIHSNDRTVKEDSDYQKDFETAQKSGNWTPFLEKHKGVK